MMLQGRKEDIEMTDAQKLKEIIEYCGIGTLIAMIGIGRVIAFVNRLFGERLAPLSDTQI